jgi:NAD(P)-dependent dehydrogenase (short-subunit alcohol dehydrogenase family)
MTANPLNMQGKVVLVTGASSGIGRETAILLSELNARVVLVGRNAGRLQETLGRMSGEGHRMEQFDLNDTEAIPDWLRRITKETGPLSGLVHSAGIVFTIPVQAEGTARIESLMRINLTSAIMLVKGFRRHGCAVRGGGIVLLSSAAGLVGSAGLSVYSASKAALIGFTRCAALELAGSGMRINCVAPGIVETEMVEHDREARLTAEQFGALKQKYPLGLGRARDVAYAIAFLLADTGRWITGSTLVVDGGVSIQ